MKEPEDENKIFINLRNIVYYKEESEKLAESGETTKALSLLEMMKRVDEKDTLIRAYSEYRKSNSLLVISIPKDEIGRRRFRGA